MYITCILHVHYMYINVYYMYIVYTYYVYYHETYLYIYTVHCMCVFVFIMRLELETLEVSWLYQAFLARSSLNASVGGLTRTFPTPCFTQCDAAMPQDFSAWPMPTIEVCMSPLVAISCTYLHVKLSRKMWKESTNVRFNTFNGVSELASAEAALAYEGLIIYMLYNALTICCTVAIFCSNILSQYFVVIYRNML